MKPRLLAVLAFAASPVAFAAMSLFQYFRRGMSWDAFIARQQESAAAVMLMYAEVRESLAALAVGSLAGFLLGAAAYRRNGGVAAIAAIAWNVLALLGCFAAFALSSR